MTYCWQLLLWYNSSTKDEEKKMKYLFIPFTITAFLSFALGILWPMQNDYDLVIKIAFCSICVLSFIGFLMLSRVKDKRDMATKNYEATPSYEITYMGFCEKNSSTVIETKPMKSLSEKIWID